MKKITALLMLFVLGAMLCPVGLVFAEDVPDDQVPELFDSTAQVMSLDIGAVNLEEEPAPNPEPEPSE